MYIKLSYREEDGSAGTACGSPDPCRIEKASIEPWQTSCLSGMEDVCENLSYFKLKIFLIAMNEE
jgi:hypothetical protein